jgi:flagellar biogenesis protein FliO
VNSHLKDHALVLPAERELSADRSEAIKGFAGIVQKFFTWTKARVARQSRKRIRISETVSLGEKRFIAVIQVDQVEFLIGGGSNSIAMLTKLERPMFPEVLKERCGGEIPTA